LSEALSEPIADTTLDSPCKTGCIHDKSGGATVNRVPPLLSDIPPKNACALNQLVHAKFFL